MFQPQKEKATFICFLLLFHFSDKDVVGGLINHILNPLHLCVVITSQPSREHQNSVHPNEFCFLKKKKKVPFFSFVNFFYLKEGSWVFLSIIKSNHTKKHRLTEKRLG